VQIRAAHIAPPVALFLAHHPLVEKYDISATEFLVSGGAPMGKEVENLVKDRLKVTVKQAYGMTEASPAVNYAEDAYRKPVRTAQLRSRYPHSWRTELTNIVSCAPTREVLAACCRTLSFE
jgi:4-coumarate--CoA ligase